MNIRQLGITLCTICLLATATTGTNARNYTEKQPLVYEDYKDLPPYSFINDNGHPAGFNIELTKLLLDKLGIPYIIKLKDVRYVLNDLKAGRSDLMISVMREDRDSICYWGYENLTVYTQSIMSPSKEKGTTIQQLSDIRFYPVTMRASSLIYNIACQQGLNEYVNAVDDICQQALMMAQKDSGTVLWNTMSLKWIKRRYRLKNMTITPLNTESRESRFLGQDSALIARMDSLYSTLPEEQLLQMKNKWFYPEIVHDKTHPHVWDILWTLMAAIVFLIVVNLYYRYKDDKTNSHLYRINHMLDIIMTTASMRVLIYSIDKQMFYILDKHGRQVIELSPIYYLDQFSSRSVERIQEAFTKIGKKQQDSEKITIYGHRNENGRRPVFDMHITRFKEQLANYTNPVVITIKDITTNIEKEAQLSHTHIQYQAALNTNMTTHIFFDADGIMQEANDNMAITLGLEDKQAYINRGIHISEMPNLGELDFTTNEDYHFSSIIHLTDPLFSKSPWYGKNLYCDVLIHPLFNNKGTFFGSILSARNISPMVKIYQHHKQTISTEETSNRKIQKHLQLIDLALQGSDTMLMEYAPLTHQFHIQRSIFQRTITIPMLRALPMINPKHLGRAYEAIKQMNLLIQKDVHTTIGMNLLNRENSRWLQFDLMPLADSQGEVTLYRGICRDVTQNSIIERQLQQEATKAQETEVLKSSFISNMSHEIRTPLHAVVGFAEMLEQSHNTDEETEFIQQIKNNSEKLLELINDTLQLSRIDANMEEYNAEPVDIVPLIRNSFEALCANRQQKGVQRMLETNYETLVINIDAKHLELIFRNAFLHAMRNTKEGYCRCRYEYRHGELIINVEDSGKGLTEKEREHAFERIYHKEKTGIVASDLTLPIANELTKHLGGRIELESYRGHGTFIWISIPCEAMELKRTKLSQITK